MAVTLTLSQAGATGYTCRDYHGDVVSTGPVAGTSFTVISPVGGWKCGWYRVYLTGPNTDSLFGDSYGSYSFIVIRDTAGYATNPTPASQLHHGSEDRDEYVHAVLGIPGPRLQISNAGNVNSGSSSGFFTDDLNSCEIAAGRLADNFRVDAVRGNPIFCQFPNTAYDVGVIWGHNEGVGAGTGNRYMHLYVKDPYVASGNVWFDAQRLPDLTSTINIYYPNSSTLVETFSGLPESGGEEPIFTSNYVVGIPMGGVSGAYTIPVTNISNVHYLGVQASVAALYPLGVHYFEGPQNEPGGLDRHNGRSIAETTRVFAKAVHDGNASAVAMGPTVVSVDDLATGNWNGWIAEGGFGFVDNLAVHAYGSDHNGDFNFLRTSAKQFTDALAANGFTKDVWITESTNVFSSVYGVYHPRRSKVVLMNSLVWEEHGVPRERNNVWYDVAHGFWTYPSWLENGDGSLNPYAALYRVLSEETFEKTFHHRIDMGSVQGNALVLGQVYTDSSNASTAVLAASSPLDSGTVTLNIEGTSQTSITYVDAWGNESTAAVTGGQITVPVEDVPTYVRLPAGTHCSVYSLCDWGHLPPQNIAGLANATVGSTSAPTINDGNYITGFTDTGATPQTVTLLFNGSLDVDRVVVFAGPCWQNDSSLADFDVQTTTDGVTWTTRKTVTKTDVFSTRFGSDSNGPGCTFETWWDEKWKFNVALGATYTCTGVRLNVRQTSYGGEPDLQASSNGMGQGANAQRVTIKEIVVPSSSTPPTWGTSYKAQVIADGAVGYWRLDEISGTTAASQVNSPTVDGTYQGSPLRGVMGALADGDFAMGGSAVGYVKTAVSTTLDLGDVFTIEFWGNTTVTGGLTPSRNYLCGKGSLDLRQPQVRIDTGVLTLLQANGSVIAAATSAPAVNGWHHYAITKNGSSGVHLYVDGQDVTGTVSNLTLTAGTGKPWYIGSTDGGDKLSGYIDEFALYATPLPASTIASHYAAASVPGGSSPSNATAPVLTGTAKSGYQIVCDQGSWSGTPTEFSYQWQRSADGTTWSNITGATYPSYVQQAADVGDYLRCNVTASVVTGESATAASDVSSAVAA